MYVLRRLRGLEWRMVGCVCLSVSADRILADDSVSVNLRCEVDVSLGRSMVMRLASKCISKGMVASQFTLTMEHLIDIDLVPTLATSS
jgi:hypothetical protein